MKLKELTKDIEDIEIFGDTNLNVLGLSFDSRKIKECDIYFCLNGTNASGNIFVNEAIKKGAVAIVCDKKLECDICQIVTLKVRRVMAKMSSNFFGNPEKNLKIVGITGTNGKTSTSYLIASILKQSGKNVGVIGTSGIFINDRVLEATMTTPDSIELFELFYKMLKEKVEYVIMEVSAHAIFFERIYGLNFMIKVLTNVASDHLDFFETQKRYEQTKLKFFETGECFVINGDDLLGKAIFEKNKEKSITFGLEKSNICYAKKIKTTLKGTNFVIKNFDLNFKVNSKLIGNFNVYNLLTAFCVGLKLGLNAPSVITYLNNVKNLPGRLDIVYSRKNFNIIIDYAHTLESLKNFLLTIKNISKNKNIIVFGEPGERDSFKRAESGELAGKFCDYIITTTDNPASENANRIAYEIEQGIKKTNCKYEYIENREEAVIRALNVFKKNCNVLIVGKGTEKYQIIGDNNIPYSDYAVVEKAITNKLFSL